jgi:ATP-dependent DNA helicase RecG
MKKSGPATTQFTPSLKDPIRFVKGVGEKLALVLGRKGLTTIEDLLFYLPRTYEDRRRIFDISDAKVGLQGSFLGKIKAAHPVFFSHSRRRAFEIFLESQDGQHRLKLTWFNTPFVAKKLTAGTLVMARGTVQQFRADLQIVHPELEILGKELDAEVCAEGIVPVYSETEGLYQKTIRRIMRTAVTRFAPFIPETLPKEILTKYSFPSRSISLQFIHQPPKDADLHELIEGRSPAHQRLIFEEFLKLSVGLAVRRKDFVEQQAHSFAKPEKLWNQFRENLPFRFTNAQRRVLHEILDDMMAPKVMHRLIQGDVGSGKTAVAAASALVALEAQKQVALMAPTELLVEQHFRNAQNWFRGMNLTLGMLTGSMSTKERREILEKLKSGEIHMIFGTHALFEKEVGFRELGLVIVDEQHRFGVRQRAALVQKGAHPDLLVMTATPIPRTLALTIYGDLDLSLIDEMPPGRKPIQTRVFTDRERPMLEMQVQEQLEQGRQAYVVFPLIEESEKLELKSLTEMLPSLQKAYSKFNVQHLHGKMKSEEKLKVLNEFREGKIQVLVSTTVVEVGVDVPNATMMIVENAERFGLSQLHQLRGRVGRGSHQSFCFLVASHMGSPEIVQRLRTMEKTQDGFKLAEVDLEMRGPGEIMGTRQSGDPVFELARLPRDFDLLQQARKEAFDIVEKDSSLVSYPHLREFIQVKSDSSLLN